MRPPIHRWSGQPTPAPDESPAPQRIKRPKPERTAPRRSPESMVRDEAGPTLPGADAVSSAYQVLDRYLEEGRKHAAGHSAWNPGQQCNSGWQFPTPLVNPMGATNWLAEVARLLTQSRQFGGALPNASQVVAGLANVMGSGQANTAPPFHPAQRADYPDAGRLSPTHPQPQSHTRPQQSPSHTNGPVQTTQPDKVPDGRPNGGHLGGVLGDFGFRDGGGWRDLSVAEVAEAAEAAEAAQDDRVPSAEAEGSNKATLTQSPVDGDGDDDDEIEHKIEAYMRGVGTNGSALFRPSQSGRDTPVRAGLLALLRLLDQTGVEPTDRSGGRFEQPQAEKDPVLRTNEKPLAIGIPGRDRLGTGPDIVRSVDKLRSGVRR